MTFTEEWECVCACERERFKMSSGDMAKKLEEGRERKKKKDCLAKVNEKLSRSQLCHNPHCQKKKDENILV